MDTDHFSGTRTTCTISEKTMEDGNVVHTNDGKTNSGSVGSLYGVNRPERFNTNGHELAGGEPSRSPNESYDSRRLNIDVAQEEKLRKRINPLRIHLGKRPFVDNSHQYLNASKKRKPFVIKTSDSSTHANVPRMPKLIPKRVDLNRFRNIPSTAESIVNNEKDKPVPRLVPKSQLLQYNKTKIEKAPQLKEYPQSLGLQPVVKFKCRKCCSMSFKTLAMLKEHQLVCRAQAKEPTLSPEAATCPEPTPGGPSRVTRKVYLCSACGTYYENWNLFLHMREVHSRHICLFCLGMFSKAEKLSSHLANKHNVKEFSYNSKEDFLNVFNGTLYLMCCVCEEICSEQDDFFNHDCNNVKPKPVPVLVSKNSVKPNHIKSIKNSNDYSTNGPITIPKELPKSYNDTKEINELRFDITSHLHKAAVSSSVTELSTNKFSRLIPDIPVTSVKDSSNTVDSGMELESLDNKPITSPIRNTAVSPDITKHLPNGDDHSDHYDDSSSPTPDNGYHHLHGNSNTKGEEYPCPSSGKEKECGIKLTLCLNSAKSPVIINSTVDPTVGQQNVNKPPSRLRRPPKRYERESSTIETTSLPTPQLKLPSIKMTICDRADSPFVKTTIYENDQETTLKTVTNNILSVSESVCTSSEPKQDSAVKSTIYDNKLEDVNTLHSVPKLTLRVPKELLDKDSSSDYSSDSDISEKLTMDENNTMINEYNDLSEVKPDTTDIKLTLGEIKEEPVPSVIESKENSGDLDPKIEPKVEPPEETPVKPVIEEPSIPVTELSLDKPLDKYPLKDLLKVFLASTIYSCIYCNHVRKIAVNCEQLSLHMVSEHRFAATVDSITAEELLPETITAKLILGAPELNSVYINLNSYDSVEKCETVQFDNLFECFQCYFKTAIHKDLYVHNRKMHQKTILLCVMCKSNFYSYSELLCHLCPGTYDSEYEIKFRCCLCNVDSIPSPFRLMVHIRKKHHTCDVCLEFCQNQARLLNHIWKHKLHHFCYRCGISYRNKPDITNHLFWKHGTESVLCKRCLQKKWPHVYHFCNPPAIFACDECNLQFTKAVYLKVHKRFHSEEFPHVCSEEGCTEKFVSKKLLNKHMLGHKDTQIVPGSTDETPSPPQDIKQQSEEPVPVIDLIDDKQLQEETKPQENKTEADGENTSKKSKKKKIKVKDALLLDVNLPALNLSESDSSDDSDSGVPTTKEENSNEALKVDCKTDAAEQCDTKIVLDTHTLVTKSEEKIEPVNEVKPSEQQVLDIWDNFKKYQAKVEKQREKTPPLVTIRKHVCESDHDYCLIPTDMNGDEDVFSSDKKTKTKKSPKKHRAGVSSSSSSSSDSDSSCSCGSNCSCSSSSGSSSSSSSDSDSSDESGNDKKKAKKLKKILPNRRISTGSNVDVMGNAETPILIPEKVEPLIAESDLETAESDTDEEFYDEHPQPTVHKTYEEKRNQLLMLASGAPSDGGSISGEASRPSTPAPEDVPNEYVEDKKVQENDKVASEAIVKDENEPKSKLVSGKKKNKKKKKSKSSRKHGPIKINIPKQIIAVTEDVPSPQLPPTKITISLQSNTVQMPEAPKPDLVTFDKETPATSLEKKRASKRRRVPNKFYGYSSDEEPPTQPQSILSALKPQLPPKLEWRKEDLPSPVNSKVKKEMPSTVISSRLYNNYTDTIRLTAPIPDAEPPRILMNTESMGSSDSDTSDEGNLEIYQPSSQAAPIPPPTYLNSGTSSLPYAFQRPAVREAREGESVYCYCRCPYDEVSEMIACDAEGCPIEWFHFECVGIMVPPKGKWYCPECRKN